MFNIKLKKKNFPEKKLSELLMVSLTFQKKINPEKLCFWKHSNTLGFEKLIIFFKSNNSWDQYQNYYRKNNEN